MLAGKFIALMAAGVAALLGAVPDFALLAVHEEIVGQAPLAAYIFYGELLTIGEGSLAGHAALVKVHQALFEFLVVVAVGNMNGTNATVEATGGKEIGIWLHDALLIFLKEQNQGCECYGKRAGLNQTS